jgi:hypothetical protein
MKNPNHRKEEYDALNDTYARFLIEEMLPEVGKKYNLTDDPEKRVDRRHVERRDLRVHGGLAAA